MIDDANKVPSGTVIRSRVVVVGAGAAGITLALELAGHGQDVVLLEAGGLNSAGKSQKLYRGELVDTKRHLPLDSDRYRQLGGTTSLWGGRCIPFDAIDFEAREHVPFSGWPFAFKDLMPFYRRAVEYCECGDYRFRVADTLPGAPAGMIDGLPDKDLTTDTLERWSPPTHFGKRYRARLKQSRNIRVYLNAVATGILLTQEGNKVSRMRVGSFGGNEFFVSADAVILAGGGLESARLLLASTEVHRAGIGNHSDWLGRGYMCHISGVAAKVRFKPGTDVIFGYEKDKDGIFCRRRLWPSEHAQRQHRLLNSYILLDRPLLSDPGHRSGLLSLAYLGKRLFAKSLDPAVARGKYGLYVRHLRNILLGSPEILMVLPKWSREHFLQGRRIPSMLTQSTENSYYLFYHTEQIPNRDSRVSLTDQRDHFGLRRLRVDFRVTDMDIDSVYRTHKLVARHLEAGGIGTLSFLSDDPRALIASHQATLGHHIGTTRMSAKPSLGVVDEHCRVHGMDNLFVAGSSVFPTSSQANPVLTIVALAIRLAESLKHEATGHDI